MRSPLRAAAVLLAFLMGVSLVSPAVGEEKTYKIERGPVNEVTVVNARDEVRVRFDHVAPSRSIDFLYWTVALDSVRRHRTGTGPYEFFLNGQWDRPRRFTMTKQLRSGEAVDVRCPEIRVAKERRSLAVSVPRSCLRYQGDLPRAMRVGTTVLGLRRVDRQTTCFVISAPRRSLGPWLAPDSARATRGC